MKSYEIARENYKAGKWSPYVPQHERPVIGTLIKLLLEDGGKVSHFDSEEYTVRKSTKFTDIKREIGCTGDEVLVAYDSAGEYLGQFNLIMHNGSEPDGLGVISDYSANDFCDGVYAQIREKYDTDI